MVYVLLTCSVLCFRSLDHNLCRRLSKRCRALLRSKIICVETRRMDRCHMVKLKPANGSTSYDIWCSLSVLWKSGYADEQDLIAEVHRHTLPAAPSGGPPLQHLQKMRKSPKVLRRLAKDRMVKYKSKREQIEEIPHKQTCVDKKCISRELPSIFLASCKSSHA